MGFKTFFSSAFLLNRSFLWLLFIINFLGTIYGYIWYEYQLQWTIETKELWMLPFVPDSPTASLFFTIALLFLLYPSDSSSKMGKWFRVIIESLAVVCSIKYGIWATAIILAGAMQGDILNWQSYMLMASHLGMAIEVLLYVRFMKVGKLSLFIATGWLLLNDTMDYTFEIYPFLPEELQDDVTVVKWSTYALSIASFLTAYLTWKSSKKS